MSDDLTLLERGARAFVWCPWIEVDAHRGSDCPHADQHVTRYEVVPPEPPHEHEPVPYNIHAGTYRSGEAVTGEITRKCATCCEWLASVPVKFPITLPIEMPT